MRYIIQETKRQQEMIFKCIPVSKTKTNNKNTSRNDFYDDLSALDGNHQP